MSFVPRTYPEIVRDLLTTLTGGTVAESQIAKDGPLTDRLVNRPVRRVSNLVGRVRLGTGASQREVDTTFTPADYELVSTTGDPNALDAIRFRDGARRPVAGTPLIINYYPVRADALPLTDLNVGSVTRTLVETIARELAVTYGQLEHVYRSAFLDTAEADALDNVAALVGMARLPPGHPVARLQFSRRDGAPGQITVPVGTAVLDAAGNRYLTQATLTFDPSETVREVDAAGESPTTALAAEGALTRTEILIAGISSVTNPQPAHAAGAVETDDAFRRRSRGALHGTVRGTLDALRYGLLSIPDVQTVTLTEAPHGISGEIRVDVAYTQDSAAARAEVRARIEELRPAGVRVVPFEAERLRLNVRVELTLAGKGVPVADLPALESGIENRLADALRQVPPGGKLRRAPLTTLVLADARVADAKIVLVTPEGESEELQLADGRTLDVQRGFAFTVATEEQAVGPASNSTVNAVLPIHLASGITLDNATGQIRMRLAGFLASRKADAPLNLDGVAAAIRDDSRFALVRADSQLTVETADGRFLQLTDGIGSYTPEALETLVAGEIAISAEEGSI